MSAREVIRAFLKGRALPEGTTRRHGGIWKRKQADGSWKPVPGEKRPRSAETKKPGHTHGHGALVREKYADGRLKPVEGDSVYMQASGMFGTPGGITGTVTRNRAGELRVSVTRVSSFLGGEEKLPAKTYPLDARWAVKDDPEIERRKHQEERRIQAEKTDREARHKNALRDADEKYAQALAQGARKPDLEKLQDGDIVTKFFPDYSSGHVDIQYFRIGHPPEGDLSDVSPDDIEYQRKIRVEDKKRNRAEGNIIGYRVDARGEPLFEDSLETVFARVGSEEEDRLVAGAFKFESKQEIETSETIEISPGKDAKTINAINSNTAQTAREIDPGLIYASAQIRKKFDPAALEELAGSIQSHGLLQPLVVRPDGKGRFEIIAGERRFRAIQALIKKGEWHRGITASVQEVDDRTKDLMQLAENFDRQDNTAGEVADFFKRLMDRHSMTVAEIAAKRGMSPQTVRAHLAITELHPDLRKELDRGNLPKTAAQLLGTLNHGQQLRAYSEMLRKNMNTGTFRNYVQALRTQGSFFSDDEIKTDEMKAAGRALGDKSPEKLQQKFQQTLDKHQHFLNKFFDADGSRLSALALAATGDFDRTMERMQLMQNEVERVMREMHKHRDKIKGDEAQEAMFKSALADFTGLRRDCSHRMAIFLVLDFLKAKGASIGEIHHWATGDYKKEAHGWSKVKKDIREHLDRLHRKAHVRNKVLSRHIVDLNERRAFYESIGKMADEQIMDYFNEGPERVSEIRRVAEKKLDLTVASLKRHTQLDEYRGGTYKEKHSPYDRILDYSGKVEQFLADAHARQLDRLGEEQVAPIQKELDEKVSIMDDLVDARDALYEKDEKGADIELEKLGGQIEVLEGEIESLTEKITKIEDRIELRKDNFRARLQDRISDLIEKSNVNTEEEMEERLNQIDSVVEKYRTYPHQIVKRGPERSKLMLTRNKILKRLRRQKTLKSLLVGINGAAAPRGPEPSLLLLTSKKIMDRLARPKMKSVAYSLMLNRAIVRFFLKGRGFPIGTRRQHGGVWKRKQADGTWKPDAGGRTERGVSHPKKKSGAKKPEGNRQTHPESGPWIESAPGLPQETWAQFFDAHPDRGGRPNQERQRLHNSVAKKFLKGTRPVGPDASPEAILMMGGPASGKSSMVKSSGFSTVNFVVADADAVKENLPEYREAVAVRARNAAQMAHEESSYLVKRIRRSAISTNRNLVVDGTGSRLNSYLTTLKDLKAKGYHTTLMLAHCNFETAWPRAITRAEKTGRFVPEKILRDSYSGTIPANFLKLKDLVDDFAVFDTRTGRNRLIYSRKDGVEKVHDARRLNDFIKSGGKEKSEKKGNRKA